MTAVEGLPTSPPSRDSGDLAPLRDGSDRAAGIREICPYLATADGAWRSAYAVRDHRCTAVAPAVPLALEKQRRLCLVASHEDCATYLAAESGHGGPRARRSGSARPIARMTPVILDPGRFDVRLPAFRADRTSGQAVLVGVLAIAFVAILLARPTGNAGSAPPAASELAAVASPSGGPPSTATAGGPSAGPTTTEPTSAATSTEAPSDGPVATATPPTRTPPPTSAPSTSGQTYRVRSGDTLVAIAARFGTTTRVLVQLNGIEDPSRLRVGQILKLP